MVKLVNNRVICHTLYVFVALFAKIYILHNTIVAFAVIFDTENF